MRCTITPARTIQIPPSLLRLCTSVIIICTILICRLDVNFGPPTIRIVLAEGRYVDVHTCEIREEEITYFHLHGKGKSSIIKIQLRAPNNIQKWNYNIPFAVQSFQRGILKQRFAKWMEFQVSMVRVNRYELNAIKLFIIFHFHASKKRKNSEKESHKWFEWKWLFWKEYIPQSSNWRSFMSKFSIEVLRSWRMSLLS